MQVLILLMCEIVIFLCGIQAMDGSLSYAHEGQALHHSASQVFSAQWEGSPEGIAYSEFNHTLAGVAVILIGLAELQAGLALKTLAWIRFLLPLGMLGFGGYLLVWSDHEAWPVGSMSLMETMLGGDWEIIQHKTLAILLLVVGVIELLGRMGCFQRQRWPMALPTFAILGGFLLFLHRHGLHPAAHQIMVHHSIMGGLAIAAGACRFLCESVYVQKLPKLHNQSRLMICWAVLILVIGVQLLLYSET